MGLMAEPIFYESLRKGAGAKRKIVYVENSEEKDLDLTVTDMEKPEWVEIEGVYPGVQAKFSHRRRTPLVANINTSHKYFPEEPIKQEKIKFTFDDESELEIAITVPEVIPTIADFRGVFALDFGTSNSCYAYRGGASGSAHRRKIADEAQVSSEMPSLIFFHDVSDPVLPRYTIGTEARFDIKENSHQTYSYLISVKRMLGRDKKLLMLDRLGTKKEHQQRWHVEEVASFLIREIVERAQEEIGERITSCVATFPPLYSTDRKEALRRSLVRAFESLGVQVEAETIVMDLDEANAASFNYIYGTMLDEFRRFDIRERKAKLLSIDFGGGTVDVSLVDVNITRAQETGKIKIATMLKGISGDPDFGGDNVTLELFKLLKTRLAAKAAVERAKELSAPAEEKKEGEGGGWDDWGGSAKAEEKKDDGFGFDEVFEEEEKKAEGGAEEEEEPEELAEIQRMGSQEEYDQATKLLADDAEIIEESISSGKSLAGVVMEHERTNGTFVSEDTSERRARAIEENVETVLPTQWAKYEDRLPEKMEVARKLFHELWHEADLLKIRMSTSTDGKGVVSGVLAKSAKYTGVEPILFNDVRFTLEELDHKIGPAVTDVIGRANELYVRSATQAVGGIQVGDANAEEVQLRILLFGNCSNLPIIKRSVAEVFQVEDEQIVFDRKTLKNSVSKGACEEYMLRKQFGEAGLIQYAPAGFLEKLPYSVGVQHKDLGFMGFPGGFAPIFQRGVDVGAETYVDHDSNFLVHSDMTDLAIYADYCDGGDPKYIGWFDFTKPMDEAETQALGADPTPPEGYDANVFAIKLKLLPTREMIATNLQTKQHFKLIVEKMTGLPEKDPFSGVH